MRFKLLESVKNSFERNNTDVLKKKYEVFKVNYSDKRFVLDQVLRDYLLQLLVKKYQYGKVMSHFASRFAHKICAHLQRWMSPLVTLLCLVVVTYCLHLLRMGSTHRGKKYSSVLAKITC